MDEKRKEEMPNKAFRPAGNAQVKIKMRLNRADSDVQTDADGVAVVDSATAERLVSDGYADYVKE